MKQRAGIFIFIFIFLFLIIFPFKIRVYSLESKPLYIRVSLSWVDPCSGFGLILLLVSSFFLFFFNGIIVDSQILVPVWLLRKLLEKIWKGKKIKFWTIMGWIRFIFVFGLSFPFLRFLSNQNGLYGIILGHWPEKNRIMLICLNWWLQYDFSWIGGFLFKISFLQILLSFALCLVAEKSRRKEVEMEFCILCFGF